MNAFCESHKENNNQKNKDCTVCNKHFNESGEEIADLVIKYIILNAITLTNAKIVRVILLNMSEKKQTEFVAEKEETV